MRICIIPFRGFSCSTFYIIKLFAHIHMSAIAGLTAEHLYYIFLMLLVPDLTCQVLWIVPGQFDRQLSAPPGVHFQYFPVFLAQPIDGTVHNISITYITVHQVICLVTKWSSALRRSKNNCNACITHIGLSPNIRFLYHRLNPLLILYVSTYLIDLYMPQISTNFNKAYSRKLLHFVQYNKSL